MRPNLWKSYIVPWVPDIHMYFCKTFKYCKNLRGKWRIVKITFPICAVLSSSWIDFQFRVLMYPKTRFSGIIPDISLSLYEPLLPQKCTWMSGTPYNTGCHNKIWVSYFHRKLYFLYESRTLQVKKKNTNQDISNAYIYYFKCRQIS